MPPLHPWQLNLYRATPAVGYLYVSGNSADAETITIGATVYTFNSLGAPGGTDIVIPNGSNAAVTTAGIVTTINAHAARVVNAINLGGDVVGVVHRTPGVAGNVAVAETMINGAWCGAAGVGPLVGGAAEALCSILPGTYTVTAQDVATLASNLGTAQIVLGAFPSTTEPRVLSVVARTAAGAIIDLADGIFTVQQVNATWWALLYAEPAGGPLLAATNVVTFVLAVPGV